MHSRAALQLEILALRRQLDVLERSRPHKNGSVYAVRRSARRDYNSPAKCRMFVQAAPQSAAGYESPIRDGCGHRGKGGDELRDHSGIHDLRPAIVGIVKERVAACYGDIAPAGAVHDSRLAAWDRAAWKSSIECQPGGRHRSSRDGLDLIVRRSELVPGIRCCTNIRAEVNPS